MQKQALVYKIKQEPYTLLVAAMPCMLTWVTEPGPTATTVACSTLP